MPRHARLEEVTVTALRKNSNQQKTAVSVTALSPTMIMRQNIQSLDQLQYRVPNLVVPPRGLVPNTLSYYIRGIGEPDSLQNQDVGIYVDDVYIARPTGATFQLSDLESINVLRGPQGTLFGRNSSAGALVINTTTPTDHVHTFAEGGVGNYNNYQFRLGASGPIKTGVLDGGISVLYHTQDGFVRNEYLRKSVGNLDVFALRAKLRWTPMERLEFILSADYDRDYSDPVPVLPRVKGVSTQHYVNYDNLAIWNKLNAGGVSLKGTYSINRYSKIRSITSYRAFDDPGVFDQDGTSLNEEITVTHHRDFDYTQELQYQYDRSRLHFAVGGFLYHDRFASSRYNAVGIGNSFVPQVGLEISNSYSLYGQGTYDILPNLHLTFGSRYTWEDHSFEYTSATKGVPWHVNNPPHHWASYTPKVGISYDINRNALVYGSWSVGYKAGGFDDRATSITAATTPFAPEIVTTYEVGLKADWLDHRFRTNLSLFYNDIGNYQTTAYDPSTGLSQRFDLGNAYSEGLELETTAQLGNNLTWQNNFTYLYSKITSAAGNPQYLGKALLYAPRFTAFSSLIYRIPLNIPGSIELSTNGTFSSRSFSDLSNSSTNALQAQGSWDGTIQYTTADRRWHFLMTVQNILGTSYSVGGVTSTYYNTILYSNPTTVLFRARYAL